MNYDKPWLSFESQADQILRRGLDADKSILIARLKAVSYYRLSGYWFPFKNPDNTFHPGTTLDKVWRRYTFDRQLRLVVIDAIERVEISVRTRLIHELSHSHGPFGYLDNACLPNLSAQLYEDFIQKITVETERSKEIFVKHFKYKYGDGHNHLPLWMAAEIMTFGILFTLFRGVDSLTKKHVASNYNVSDRVLESWLRALNGVRNICAHHGRLWNRELGYKPTIPRDRKNPEWHEPITVNNNRIFAILTILKYLMNFIAPQSQWCHRFNHLLAKYPDIPLLPMGFSENWQECPIWRE